MVQPHEESKICRVHEWTEPARVRKRLMTRREIEAAFRVFEGEQVRRERLGLQRANVDPPEDNDFSDSAGSIESVDSVDSNSDAEYDYDSLSNSLVRFIMLEYAEGHFDKAWLKFYFEHEGFREAVRWRRLTEQAEDQDDDWTALADRNAQWKTRPNTDSDKEFYELNPGEIDVNSKGQLLAPFIRPAQVPLVRDNRQVRERTIQQFNPFEAENRQKEACSKPLLLPERSKSRYLPIKPLIEEKKKRKPEGRDGLQPNPRQRLSNLVEK